MRLEGRPLRMIGRSLGVSEGTVKSTLFTAKGKLKKALLSPLRAGPNPAAIRLRGKWVTVEEEVVTGYRTTETVRHVPETRTAPAEAGMAVRMADVKTGEILWSGTATEQAFSLEEAVDGAARRILKAVERTWPIIAPLSR